MGKKDDAGLEDFKQKLRDSLEDEEMLKWLFNKLKGLFAAHTPEHRTNEDGNTSSLANPSHAQPTQREQALERELSDAHKQITNLQHQVSQFEGELKQAHTQVRAQASQHASDLETLKKELNASQQKCKDLEKRSLMPPDWASLLARVREDADLAGRFSLNTALGDVDLLVQTVAVLSDGNNIKRLWDSYKKRCEDQRGPLNSGDEHLLEAALTWYNTKWPADSQQALNRPVEGSSYDYEKHMRPAIGMTGETIVAVWLSGIPGLKLKPLVATE